MLKEIDARAASMSAADPRMVANGLLPVGLENAGLVAALRHLRK